MFIDVYNILMIFKLNYNSKKQPRWTNSKSTE